MTDNDRSGIDGDLTDAEVEKRWAWMAVALRDMPNLEDVLDRVCGQARRANALRAALAEAIQELEWHGQEYGHKTPREKLEAWKRLVKR